MRRTGGKQGRYLRGPQAVALAAFACCAVAGGAFALGTACTGSLSGAQPNPAGFAALEGSAFADDDEEASGAQFFVDGLQYEVVQASDDGGEGAVALVQVPSETQGGLSIPDKVVSARSGRAYRVSEVRFEAFAECSHLTKIELPSSVESYTFQNTLSTSYSNACLPDCAALASVEVGEGSPCLLSDDGVLYAKGQDGNPVALLCYPRAKADSSSFAVPETVRTVAAYAASGNAALTSVSFTGDLTGDADAYAQAGSMSSSYMGGIGAGAFANCSSLSKVAFAEGLKLGVAFTGSAVAIGNSAFENCVSLKSITIPNIESATRKADAYRTFEENNPGSNQVIAKGSAFLSGFDPYWHNQSGPVAREGVGSSAFSGCTNLRSVTFAAGNVNGAFAYLTGTTTYFAGCNKLESLVFESSQTYWGNPSTSMANGKFVDIWYDESAKASVVEKVPTRYYAVDYYATAADADAADSLGSTRLARVEYAAGTATSDIATSSAALSGCTADAELYASLDADGKIPSAAEAAASAGLGEGAWAWKLTGTQSRREGLTESCKAYLVRADDVSAGRLDSQTQTALYLACDRNLSESEQADCAFDPARYASGSSYQIAPLEGEADPWYTYDASAGGLVGGFSVRSADGTLLDPSEYSVTYKRYDPDSGELIDAALSEGSGAYLVCVTPAAGSGYTGELDEWIVVKNHAGNVVSGFSDTVSGTAEAARHAFSQTSTLDYSGRCFAVTIGASDGAGALVAAGYAGLVGGAVNVDDSESASYGFSINSRTDASGKAADSSNDLVFSRTDSDGAIQASDWAVKCYRAFERNRDRLGASVASYPWGKVAVLVPSLYEQYYAAAANWAYAMHAPVFLTDDDGSVSDDTVACLSEFSQVVVMGSETAFSQEGFAALGDALAKTSAVSRLQGASDTAGAFSLALADDLIARDAATMAAVAVVDSITPSDAVASVTFTGHEKGVVLTALGTDDAKLIAEHLHAASGGVGVVLLAGRGGDACASQLASSEWSGSAFGAIWEADASFEQVMGAITSSVDGYANIAITRPDRTSKAYSGDAGKRDGSASGATSGGSASKQGSSATVVATYGGATSYAVGSAGAASASAKVAANAASGDASLASGSATDAVSGDASATDDASSVARSSSSISSTPSSVRVPFLISIGVLCAAAAPVLRRCK